MTENDVHCLVCWIRVSCNPIHSFLPLIILQKYIHSTHLSGRLELSVCMCRLCICLSMCLCVGVLVSICVHQNKYRSSLLSIIYPSINPCQCFSGSSMYGPGDSGKAPERRGSSRDRDRGGAGDRDRGRDRGSDRGERRRSRSRDRR